MSPIFIVGAPRSGTTVFSVQLAKTYGIAMAPETHFMSEVFSPLQNLNLKDERNLNITIDRFANGRWFPFLEIDKGQIKKAFRKQSDQTWPVLFNTILQIYAHSKKAVYYGEKTPGHYHHVSQFLNWYPECRVIFMMRDPRAVVASNLQAPFSPSYTWFIAKRWNDVAAIHQQYQSDPRIIKVCYEDFVEKPEMVLAQFHDYLAIDPKKLHIPKITPAGQRNVGWRKQHLLKAQSKVNKKSLSKWRKDLSDYDIWLTERIASPLMKCYGYIPEVFGIKKRGLNDVRYFFEYPPQRLSLTITWAMRPEWNKTHKKGAKAAILRVIGKGFDWLLYVRFLLDIGKSLKKQTSAPKNMLAVVNLRPQNVQSSFFHPLSEHNETLGLFVNKINKLGYEVRMASSSRSQFLAARKIVHAFGLDGKVQFLKAPMNYDPHNGYVHIFRPGKRKPVQRFYSFDNETMKKIKD